MDAAGEGLGIYGLRFFFDAWMDGALVCILPLLYIIHSESSRRDLGLRSIHPTPISLPLSSGAI